MNYDFIGELTENKNVEKIIRNMRKKNMGYNVDTYYEILMKNLEATAEAKKYLSSVYADVDLEEYYTKKLNYLIEEKSFVESLIVKNEEAQVKARACEAKKEEGLKAHDCED